MPQPTYGVLSGVLTGLEAAEGVCLFCRVCKIDQRQQTKSVDFAVDVAPVRRTAPVKMAPAHPRAGAIFVPLGRGLPPKPAARNRRQYARRATPCF
jgi:hypothetical protein